MKLSRDNPRPGMEDGAVAVEMALVIPWLVLAVLGLMALGLLFWIWNTMQLGVDEGGRYAMVMFRNGTGPPSWSSNGVCTGLDECTKKYTQKILGNYAFGFPTVTANCYLGATKTSCASADQMVVTARYTMDFIIKAPLIVQATVPLVSYPFKMP